MIGRLCLKYLSFRGNDVKSLRPKSGPKSDAYFYNEDNIATPRNHDFAYEDRFIQAFDEYLAGPFTGRATTHHHGRWNLHVSFWAASHAIALGADIVQLGVFEGSEAAAMVKFTEFSNAKINMFLVDTFTGVPEDQWTAEEIRAGANSAQWAYKEMGDLYEFTTNRMSPYSNVHVIRGRVPDVLPEIQVEKIGLLMLDMNCALPEKAAAEYLWDKVVPGGIVISDDYGHSRAGAGFIEQKRAFDEFANSKNLEVLTLPTGHGVLIKT